MTPFTRGRTVILPNRFKEVLHRLDEILEKKKMQREISKLNELPRTILNSINESIAIIQLDDYKITSVNKHFLEERGLIEEEVIGKTCYQVTHQNQKPCSMSDCCCPLPEVMRTGGHVSTIHSHRDKNGKATYVEISTSPITESDEKIRQVVYFTRDITERKETELSLIRQRRNFESEHEKINQAFTELKKTQSHIIQQEKMATIGQLAAGVAHEINNPVGFIASNLSTLKNYIEKIVIYTKAQEDPLQALADDQSLQHLSKLRKDLKLDYVLTDLPELIQECLEGTDRVRDIVTNLKSFSRISDNEETEYNINDCLETTLKIVWNELKYKAEIQKEYGRLSLVKCLPQQLNQVFMNILVNASHSMEEKGIIRIKTEMRDGKVHVRISDTGCGIPQKNLGKIFEPFFTTKESGKGTGLGMSISLDIIKKHNGEIRVESKEGKGTTFTVILPVID